MGIVLALLLTLVGTGCRGRAPDKVPAEDLKAMVDSLVPAVERATHLKFKHPPKFAIRTKDEVTRYVTQQLNQQFPAGKVNGLEMTYKLLDLIPDSANVRDLLLPLYSEQVAGYYDPDSTTLYAVEGSKGTELRLVLAHELVHALQHEQLPLEQILKDHGDSDRLAAEQAVLEGHAILGMLGVVLPDQSAINDPDFWRQYREQIRATQSTMPMFAQAPVVLQESLIFPYLAGAEFMRWWASEGKPPLPTLEQLPHSTEQILHPDRYQKGDQPLTVRFTDSSAAVIHEDTMGELELQIFSASVRGGGLVHNDLAIGWGGDRVRLYQTPAGPAVVLVTVWDDSVSARGFAQGPAARFAARARPGYKTIVEPMMLDGKFAVRVVRAPVASDLWSALPTAKLQ